MKKIVRRGFTLPEVLVTVTVVAVLAAVVVPAVTQYASKGDAPSTKSDINQLVTAVTAFTSDVRKYPGDLRQLANAITTTSNDYRDTAATATTFGTADAAKWKGPYTPTTFSASGYATISGLQVQVGPGVRISTDAWLQTPIVTIANAAPDCVSIAALDAAVDGSNSGATTGQVQWGGGLNASGVCNAITSPMLRLIPAP